MSSEWKRWEVPSMDMAGSARTPVPSVIAMPAGPSPEVEEARLAAWQEGLERGLAEGRELGLSEMRGQAQRLEQLLDRLERPFAGVDGAVEQELMQLAMVLARQLVRHELRTEPEQVVGVVREALAALPSGQRHVSVQLHPDDARLVRQALADEPDLQLRIIDMPGLQRGDCQVQSDQSRIDERLDVRLERLVSQLMGDLPAGAHS